MGRIWHTAKGYVAGAVAFVACPCHLPLTLPLFLALTAGTAIGAWLSANTVLIYIIFTVLFLGGLLLSGKWLMGDKTISIPVSAGLADVVLVSSPTCSSCADAARLWEGVRIDYRFRFQKVDITSGKGRSLAAKHNILTTPTTLINGRVAFRGVPKQQKAIAAVKQS